MMSFRNPVGGVMMALLLFLSSTLGTIVLVTPTLPAIFLSPYLSRRIMDFFISLWFLLAVALYEMMIGMKVVVKGFPAKRGTSSLILANHRTRLDWLFLMSYLVRFSKLSEYRISLKAPLKKFPGAGWAMQCAGFLFLKRKWDEDKDHISNGLHYFSKVHSKPQFLLFPEGTDMCPNAIARSNAFAEKKGYPEYKYVLHPKTTGFIHFIREMKKGQIVDSVLDVSVAYPKTLIHDEFQMLKGQYPEEIHFYIKSHPIQTIPDSDEDLEQWCRDLWQQKEQRLERFYENKYFEDEAPVSSNNVEECTPKSDADVRKLLKAVMVFWLVFLAITFTCLIFFPMFRWFCVIGCITFVIIGIRQGGVDNVIYNAVKHHH